MTSKFASGGFTQNGQSYEWELPKDYVPGSSTATIYVQPDEYMLSPQQFKNMYPELQQILDNLNKQWTPGENCAF